MLLVSQKEYLLQGWSLDKLNQCFLWCIEHTWQNLGQFFLDQYIYIYISISMSLSEDTGIKQSFCPNSLYRKYIISRILDTVAFLDFLIQWLVQDSFTLSRSVWKRSAKETQRASMKIASRIKNVGFVGVEVDPPTWSLFAKMWPLTNTQSFSFHLIMPYLLARPELFTRDDIVSQRLKFGSTFLSSSWESKIAMFF